MVRAVRAIRSERGSKQVVGKPQGSKRAPVGGRKVLSLLVGPDKEAPKTRKLVIKSRSYGPASQIGMIPILTSSVTNLGLGPDISTCSQIQLSLWQWLLQKSRGLQSIMNFFASLIKAIPERCCFESVIPRY